MVNVLRSNILTSIDLSSWTLCYRWFKINLAFFESHISHKRDNNEFIWWYLQTDILEHVVKFALFYYRNSRFVLFCRCFLFVCLFSFVFVCLFVCFTNSQQTIYIHVKFTVRLYCTFMCLHTCEVLQLDCIVPWYLRRCKCQCMRMSSTLHKKVYTNTYNSPNSNLIVW